MPTEVGGRRESVSAVLMRRYSAPPSELSTGTWVQQRFTLLRLRRNIGPLDRTGEIDPDRLQHESG
jgi:hypothetical protein